MLEKLNYPHIGIFIIAWLIADILSAIFIKISPVLNAIDTPHSYKTHENPTSFLGGVAIYIAISVSLFSTIRFSGFFTNLPLFILIFCSFIILIIGLFDDFHPYSAIIKLTFLLLTTYILFASGIRLHFFSDNLWVLNLLLGLIWIAGITSAVNSLDHADGLAGGICAISAAATFYIAWKNYPAYELTLWHNYLKWLSYISIAICGALIGFLRYNIFSPAKIFLGDNGSLTLGFIIAASAIIGGWSANDRLRSFIVPCTILVVPLFDITASTIFRILEKRVHSIKDAILYCGKDHISHRLIALGFTRKESILLIYNMGILGGIFAVIISNPYISVFQYIIVTLLGLFCLFLFGIMLAKATVQ